MTVVVENYEIREIIGTGGVGKVYEGIDKRNGEKVAVKLEQSSKTAQGLDSEYYIYKEIQDGDGIPHTKHFERQENYDIMIMELLGQSLKSKFHYCSSKFSLRTVLLLADQMLSRLEYIHSKNIIHRDIKPENFMFGTGNDKNKLYLIDFGVAKKYRDQNNKHIPLIVRKSFVGNMAYASVRAHVNHEQSRRDDLESMGYVLIHLLTGTIPWTKPQVTHKKFVMEKYQICNTLKNSVPEPFLTYIKLCRSLGFSEDPSYSKLRQLFKDLYSKQKYVGYELYDWDIMEGDSAYSSE